MNEKGSDAKEFKYRVISHMFKKVLGTECHIMKCYDLSVACKNIYLLME